MSQEILFKTSQELREWFRQNWSLTNGIWIVYYKKAAGIGTLNYDQIVDTALCFGWIDSKPNKVDEQKTKLWLAPRNPKSNWSKVNKLKVERLENLGLIEENGKKLIEIAKQNGCWDALNDIENLILPKDLEIALNQDIKARASWENLARSTKRGLLETLLNCKKDETRNKKIKEIVKIALDKSNIKL